MSKPSFTAGIILGISFIGVVLAAIEKGLYDNGVGVNFLTAISLTITELMTITVVLFILLAVFIGMLQA